MLARLSQRRGLMSALVGSVTPLTGGVVEYLDKESADKARVSGGPAIGLEGGLASVRSVFTLAGKQGSSSRGRGIQTSSGLNDGMEPMQRVVVTQGGVTKQQPMMKDVNINVTISIPTGVQLSSAEQTSVLQESVVKSFQAAAAPPMRTQPPASMPQSSTLPAKSSQVLAVPKPAAAAKPSEAVQTTDKPSNAVRMAAGGSGRKGSKVALPQIGLGLAALAALYALQRGLASRKRDKLHTRAEMSQEEEIQQGKGGVGGRGEGTAEEWPESQVVDGQNMAAESGLDYGEEGRGSSMVAEPVVYKGSEPIHTSAGQANYSPLAGPIQIALAQSFEEPGKGLASEEELVHSLLAKPVHSSAADALTEAASHSSGGEPDLFDQHQGMSGIEETGGLTGLAGDGAKPVKKARGKRVRKRVRSVTKKVAASDASEAAATPFVDDVRKSPEAARITMDAKLGATALNALPKLPSLNGGVTPKEAEDAVAGKLIEGPKLQNRPVSEEELLFIQAQENNFESGPQEEVLYIGGLQRPPTEQAPKVELETAGLCKGEADMVLIEEANTAAEVEPAALVGERAKALDEVDLALEQGSMAAEDELAESVNGYQDAESTMGTEEEADPLLEMTQGKAGEALPQRTSVVSVLEKDDEMVEDEAPEECLWPVESSEENRETGIDKVALRWSLGGEVERGMKTDEAPEGWVLGVGSLKGEETGPRDKASEAWVSMVAVRGKEDGPEGLAAVVPLETEVGLTKYEDREKGFLEDDFHGQERETEKDEPAPEGEVSTVTLMEQEVNHTADKALHSSAGHFLESAGEAWTDQALQECTLIPVAVGKQDSETGMEDEAQEAEEWTDALTSQEFIEPDSLPWEQDGVYLASGGSAQDAPAVPQDVQHPAEEDAADGLSEGSANGAAVLAVVHAQETGPVLGEAREGLEETVEQESPDLLDVDEQPPGALPTPNLLDENLGPVVAPEETKQGVEMEVLKVVDGGDSQVGTETWSSEQAEVVEEGTDQRESKSAVGSGEGAAIEGPGVVGAQWSEGSQEWTDEAMLPALEGAVIEYVEAGLLISGPAVVDGRDGGSGEGSAAPLGECATSELDGDSLLDGSAAVVDVFELDNEIIKLALQAMPIGSVPEEIQIVAMEERAELRPVAGGEQEAPQIGYVEEPEEFPTTLTVSKPGEFEAVDVTEAEEADAVSPVVVRESTAPNGVNLKEPKEVLLTEPETPQLVHVELLKDLRMVTVSQPGTNKPADVEEAEDCSPLARIEVPAIVGLEELGEVLLSKPETPQAVAVEEPEELDPFQGEASQIIVVEEPRESEPVVVGELEAPHDVGIGETEECSLGEAEEAEVVKSVILESVKQSGDEKGGAGIGLGETKSHGPGLDAVLGGTESAGDAAQCPGELLGAESKAFSGEDLIQTDVAARKERQESGRLGWEGVFGEEWFQEEGISKAEFEAWIRREDCDWKHGSSGGLVPQPSMKAEVAGAKEAIKCAAAVTEIESTVAERIESTEKPVREMRISDNPLFEVSLSPGLAKSGEEMEPETPRLVGRDALLRVEAEPRAAKEALAVQPADGQNKAAKGSMHKIVKAKSKSKSSRQKKEKALEKTWGWWNSRAVERLTSLVVLFWVVALFVAMLSFLEKERRGAAGKPSPT